MGYNYERKTAAETFDQWYENISFKASQKVRDLDETFVGTPDYMGIAYFWNLAYKYEMRATSSDKRRAVHRAFLKDNLPLDGESPEHAAIVKRLVG